MAGDSRPVPASTLQPGRYCVVRTRGLSGWLIRVFTRSPYDHAFIVLEDALIAEATVRGVRVDRLATYRGQQAAVSGDKMTGTQRAAVAAKARSFTGREYNWADIMLIGLRLLGLRWGWLRRLLRDRDALICSELVAEAGAAGGLDWLCGEPDAALVTPADLARRGVVPVTWD